MRTWLSWKHIFPPVLGIVLFVPLHLGTSSLHIIHASCSPFLITVNTIPHACCSLFRMGVNTILGTGGCFVFLRVSPITGTAGYV